MKISSLKYYTKEASRNVFSNGWMSVASILTVVASLLVFGLFMTISINLSYIAQQAEADYEIILIMDETCTPQRVEQIGEEVRGISNVRDAELNPGDKRLDELKEDMGSGAALLDGYEGENNPLRDWYMVTMGDLEQASDTVAQLEQIQGVVRVARNQDTINTLLRVTDTIGHVSIGIMIALAIVSVFIISNTIKLTVFARRREINIMKFVGATDWFIRWPFIIEGIIIGFIGCIVSLAVIGFGYHALLGLVQDLDIRFVELVPFGRLFLPSTGIFALMGIVLGGLGSLISVRKYLNV